MELKAKPFRLPFYLVQLKNLHFCSASEGQESINMTAAVVSAIACEPVTTYVAIGSEKICGISNPFFNTRLNTAIVGNMIIILVATSPITFRYIIF